MLDDPMSDLPSSVRPFIRDLNTVLPEPGTVRVRLSGYSAISDLSPLAQARGVHILELSAMPESQI